MIDYESTGNELSDRILALIPSHPEILQLEDAWGLFRIKGFKCDDIAPSLAQVQWALSNAVKRANNASTRLGGTVAKPGEGNKPPSG